jgi:tetratricopeptide (TPR) repeat protein
VWHGGLLWDDDGHLTRRDLASLYGLWRIWFEIGATQQYYPAVHSAFWLFHALWGANTLGYHLANITLHASSAFLVAVILRRLRVPGAMLAAVVFALHPMQVESVAWMSELKNTLSGVLYLGSFLAYLRFRDQRAPWTYRLALALFVAAVLSKSVTASLPAAILVVIWWQRGRITMKGDVRPLAPFFAVGLISGIGTAWIERTLIGAQGADFQFSLLERTMIAGRALWFYLATIVWPAHLTFIYPRWDIAHAAISEYLAPVSVIAVSAGLWMVRSRSRTPLAAALFFAGTLLPALGFVNIYPFRYSFVADHFAYLASLGVIVPLSALIAVAAARIAHAKQDAIVAAVTVAVGAVLAVCTWQQSALYTDSETLFRATLVRNPDCWMAYNNLGSILLSRRPHAASAAVPMLEKAIALNPANAEAHTNLGLAWEQLGRIDAALAEHQTAVKLQPRLALGHNNLGNIHARLERPDEAIAEFQEALRLDPELKGVHSNLALALTMAGRLPEAVAEAEAAVDFDPDDAEAHDAYGLVLADTGRFDDAVKRYQEAVQLDPENAEAHNHLANALRSLDRATDALPEHREALRLDPDNAVVHHDLALSLDALDRMDDALVQYREAVLRQPEMANLQDDLGDALRRSGQADEAVRCFKRAVAIQPNYGPAHFHLGLMLQRAGALENAATEYEAALTYGASGEVHNNLGVVLIQLGRKADAVAHFREAVRLNPTDSEAASNLKRALAER